MKPDVRGNDTRSSQRSSPAASSVPRSSRDSTVDGLVFALALDGKGGARSVGWREVRAWQPGAGVLWVHLDRKGAESQRYLRQQSGLPQIAIEELLSDVSRPGLLELEGGALLNLRGVNTNAGSAPEDMVRLMLWVENARLITSRHRRVAAAQDVRGTLTDPAAQGPADVGGIVLLLAERLLDRLAPVIEATQASMEELEVERAGEGRRQQRLELMQLRQRTNKLRRWAGPQQEVITRMVTDRALPFDRGQRQLLAREADRVTRYVEDLTDLRDRASAKHDELSQAQAEDTSRMMFILSVAAAIFLPLTLLTELAGVDAAGIAGREQSLPFLVVVVALMVIGIAMAAVFWRLRHRYL